jgi:SAM-dependent methyltransferase
MTLLTIMEQPNEYNLVDRVYVRDGDPDDFGYNDGDETEEYIHTVFREAADLGTGSAELAGKIRDWPTLYHLSPQRADLLRPFSGYLRDKTVLEIGSGCGAITRYLGESAAAVVAVEGSRRRARITAERCRDLANVTAVGDNFDRFRWSGQFDVVTLIGVLEYSNLYIGGSEPSVRLLEKAGSFLRENGVLIIAIENKLGSKYWAGAPEDHTGQAYYGIENRYNSETAITYGKEELSALLTEAGYSSREYFFPFPDYKLPTVILREKHLDAPAFNVANLIMPNADYFQGSAYESAFSLALAMKEIAANKLVGDLANSFLVVAGRQPAAVVPDDIIGHTFSSLRKRAYAKENRFVLEAGGQIVVQRIPLYPGVPPEPHPWLSQHIEEERYIGGDIYFNYLIGIISKPGWSADDLIEWVRPFYRLLKSLSTGMDGLDYLDGRYADAVPFNMLFQEGTIRLFDLEWVITEPLPLSYILCRGIYLSIGRAGVFRLPAAGTSTSMFPLVEEILRPFVQDTGQVMKDFIEREKKYFGRVGLKEDYCPGDLGLNFNEGANERERKEKEAIIARLTAEKEDLTAENDNFKKSISWYRSTYEQRSLAGLLLTRVFRRARNQ